MRAQQGHADEKDAFEQRRADALSQELPDPHAEHEEKNLKADKLLRVLREMWDSPGKQERHAEPTKHVEPTEPTKHAEQGDRS